MELKLSILIRTLPDRKNYLSLLRKELHRQIDELGLQDQVEILMDDTPRGKMTAGAKANRLKSKSTALYIAYHDDDDFPAPNYLRRIMEGIATGLDIITFNMNYYEDGKYVRKYIINRFIGEVWTEAVYTIDRIYFHLCAVKREKAMLVNFPDANFQEDLAYSDDLKPLLKTEHHINEELYNYYFDRRLSATRDYKTSKLQINTFFLNNK